MIFILLVAYSICSISLFMGLIDNVNPLKNYNCFISDDDRNNTAPFIMILLV
jgi:hypothetical protein